MKELNDKVRRALINMDFIKRYEELSNRFSSERTPSNERLEYVDCDEVIDMLLGLGYTSRFVKKEKFFQIKEEQIGTVTSGFHIILRDGMADLVWVVRENGELLLGEPWGIYSRRLIDANYRIKKPVFRTYEDLEDILKVAFGMYEDFKKALMQE